MEEEGRLHINRCGKYFLWCCQLCTVNDTIEKIRLNYKYVLDTLNIVKKERKNSYV